MTYLPPDDAMPPDAYAQRPVSQFVTAPQYAPAQPYVAAPQYLTAQPAPIPVRRGAWLLPLLALLALAAIGGAIGLYLHRQHGITEVEAGQCFANLTDITDPNQQELLAHRVDCSQPHTAEVIAVINRPSEIHEGSILDWPHISAVGNTVVGAAQHTSLEEWPEETCTYRFNDYIGVPPEDSNFVMLPFPMFLSATQITDDASLHEALDHSDWKLVCMVGHEERTGSVRNYAR